jgi:hypothetical protein
MLVILSSAPVNWLKTSLCEVDFIEEYKLSVFKSSCLEVGNTLLFFEVVLQFHVIRQILLLSDLFALHLVLQIESSKWGHSDSFFGEPSMKQNGSLLECLSRPKLKSLFA